MATKTLLTQIKLRRDNYFNYEAKENTFIPLKGEVCLVDTARQGLRAKVGDGVSTWKNLPYTDEEIYKAIDVIIQRGYYFDGEFYSDSEHTVKIAKNGGTIYIDVGRNKVYIYNDEYVCINSLPTASDSEAGILKLYPTTG